MENDKFKPIKWEETKIGDIVYLSGTNMGQFKAYGPHTVVNPTRHCLMNLMGNKFLHFTQDLLILEDKE